MIPFLLLLAFVVPFAWFLAEFQNRRWLRILLGISSLFGIFFIGALLDAVRGLNANTYYSTANEELIKATRVALESGKVDEVIVELKRLDNAHEPTYERPHYQELVSAYAQKLAGKQSNVGD